MKPSIVIIDVDEGYVLPLEQKILSELQDTISLEVITERGYLADYLSSPHDIDILLVAEEIMSEDVMRQNAAQVFVLTEDQSIDATHDLKTDYLFKYSSMNSILNAIVASSDLLKTNAEQLEDTRVLLFYSPVGGSGKSTLAAACASYLSSMFKRVLFVDAEYVQTVSHFLVDCKKAPDAMARAACRGEEALYDGMRQYILSDQFDYLPPFRATMSAFGIDFRFFTQFVREVKEARDYDFVVVDVDSVFDYRTEELFGIADEVIVPVTQEPLSLHKASFFVGNLMNMDVEKMHIVCNKFKSGEGNAFLDGSARASIVVDAYVDYDKSIPEARASALGALAGIKNFASTLL